MLESCLDRAAILPDGEDGRWRRTEETCQENPGDSVSIRTYLSGFVIESAHPAALGTYT